MRLLSAFARVALVATLSGCASIPFMNDIPLWHNDPDKIAALGKGASVADIDKALGRTRLLWSMSVDVNGTPYQFRLYDWVERAAVTGHSTNCSTNGCTTTQNMKYDKLPYALVYTGAEPRLHAWGTLAELRASTDPAVVAALPQLTRRYNEYKYPRRQSWL
ncbi:hypothetical protein [Pseudoduganella violacea]|uniref:Lipoprotein n=1 Tax=Pseudoduganella violacea TaxID=1715466 RepID=A0A7W5B6A7_9BURK|nr:hypothetical protein [Pseudoduganella violacea]MBB3117361.1 hypothetical protein [Pseudoduganella violacea]